MKTDGSKCSVLAVLFGLCSGACGSAQPAPTSPAKSEVATPAEPAAEAASPLAGDDAPDREANIEVRIDSSSRTPEATVCEPSCAKLIAVAQQQLDQAEAMKDEPKAYGSFSARAGNAFVKAWRGCLLEIPEGTDLACEGGRKVVGNMVWAFEASHREDGAIYSNLVAMDARWASPDAGPIEEGRARLQAAADRAEKSATSGRKAEHGAETVEAAAYARLALGDPVRARQDLALYRQNYPKNRKEAIQLAAMLASHYNDGANYAGALAALGPAPSANDDARARILWRSELARALAGSKRSDQASTEFEGVLSAWPADKKAALALAGGMAPWPMADRERAVDAIGAALFFRADQKRAAADAFVPPRPTGPATAQAFSSFFKTKIADWAAKKQERIRDAARAYDAIAAIQPAPSRRWLVAASCRTGQMYERYLEQFQAIPMPAAMARDPESRSAYDRAVESSLAPVLDAAKAAFSTCAERAKRLHVDDGDVRICQKWIEQHSR